jgi:hypothetical protein
VLPKKASPIGVISRTLPCPARLSLSAILLPLWRTKDEYRYNPSMSVSRCRVSVTDSEGISHAVEVQAESLYEAVALAVSEFRNDSVTSMPGPMTEFMVSIQRPSIEHRIRLGQVSQWAAQGGTKEGPAGITRRQRILRLLENT